MSLKCFIRLPDDSRDAVLARPGCGLHHDVPVSTLEMAPDVPTSVSSRGLGK